MKKFSFTINGNEYEVEIKKFENKKARVEVNGTCYNVELNEEKLTTKTPILVRSSIKRPKDSHKIQKSESATFIVKAPLPGNIMQIFVKVGDEVKKDDPLLLYEAMKMENKILCEKDGVITSVKVNPGDNVLQDDVLLEIKIN
jgi:biotin carboxyl carrier protein